MDINSELSYINKIEFCVFSNQEVKKYSVINDQFGIDIPETYENKEPKQGGVIDKRLGVTDYNIVCDTCGLLTNLCPGHFGHTELAEEVFHYGYLDIVKNILSCICLNCSKLLITKKKEEIIKILGTSFSKNRFAKIKKLTSNVKYCQYPDNNCGKQVGKITKDINKSGSINIIASYTINNSENDEVLQINSKKKKNIEILSPSKIYNILKNIDDDEIKIMGFDPAVNRPENFIIKNFPIPPVAIRPSVRLEMLNSSSSEDGLTLKLVNIVKDNLRLKKQKERMVITGEEVKYNQDYRQLLQYDIATYFDNDTVLPKSEQKGSKVSKSVSERLKGKGGRIRGNLMGKRVEYSARTVITSDPNLAIDELGVPIKIAINLTMPEVVSSFNIDRLTKCVKNGRYIYPGANFVIPYNTMDTDKKYKKDLRYTRKSIVLHYFDIVERHIIDGDVVLFNRQPTLHKYGMMCFKIKVIPNNKLNTFRINVTVTEPFNADFDGDEMNMFVPQNVQTSIEIIKLADVKKQIIGIRKSEPLVILKQDSIIGSYLMTETEYMLDYKDAMNLLLNCSDSVNISILKKNNISSRDVFSLIIPDMINYMDSSIEIVNGRIKNGIMTSKILNNKILTYCWENLDTKIIKDLYYNIQKLITNWLLIYGFTIGISDAIIDKKKLEDIYSIIEIKIMESEKLITEMENNPESLIPDIFEKNLIALLTSQKGQIQKIINDYFKSYNKENNFYLMYTSGTKGSAMNTSEVIGCLGQNLLEQKRIKKKVNNRTLVHLYQNDDSALARGFVKNSYYKGLNAVEYFFTVIASREGVIDTAIKSVIGPTEIIIIENGETKKVQIGDWIDNLLLLNTDKVKKVKEKEMEILELDGLVYIPTTNNKGKIEWGQITNITRHDPGKELFEIKTLSGRNVIVTECHSLLIWSEEKKEFEQTSAKNVNLGDKVPITKNLYYENNEMKLNNYQGLIIGIFIILGKLDDNRIIFNDVNNNILINIVNCFNNLNIKYEIENNNIVGYSKNYSLLLNKFKNNIDPMCFTESLEFIINLITGIFSCNNTVYNNAIILNLPNIDLINDINFCLYRLNIFTVIQYNEEISLIIFSDNLKIFNKAITLININYIDDIFNIIDEYININDIILDPIISINNIDIKKYNKVYDLTVPSTINFGLANGLHVVDTSDSGYLQRKLIKGMEDIMMCYDKTIRSSNNSIIQIFYGRTNINQVLYKSVIITLIELSDIDIKNNFIFTENEIKELSKKFHYNKDELLNWNNKLYEKYKYFRDELRKFQKISNMNNITLNNNYKLPVNLKRIIDDVINMNITSDELLDPLYIIHAINYILKPEITNINLLPENYDINSFKYKDQERAKIMLKIGLFEYLCPKKCINIYKLSKQKFDIIVKNIIKSFLTACIEPGTMVGVLTAQTLGEILTQMSINYNTKIIIQKKNKKTGNINIIVSEVGNFIDEYYEKYSENIINIPEYKNSTEFCLDNIEDEIYICGVSNDEKVKWNKIKYFSRHSANGNLLKITTLGGRMITTTKSHNFLQRSKEGIIKPINGDKLKIGDRIPVVRSIKLVVNNETLKIGDDEYKLTEDLGIFLGNYLLNGKIVNDTIILSKSFINFTIEDVIVEPQKNIIIKEIKLVKMTRENFYNSENLNKRIPEFVHNSNINFIRGILKGFIVIDNKLKLNNYIKIRIINNELLKDISLLLNYFGIFTINTNKYLKIPNKYYKKLENIISINLSEYLKENSNDYFDMIPELYNTIFKISFELYGHPTKCRKIFNINNIKINNTIRRNTLYKYIKMFKEHSCFLDKFNIVINDIQYLENIADGDVVWDKIIKIEEINDTNNYVYDFTIPNNETFMTYEGIFVHNTLNTFHASGEGVIGMQGIPRFREILSYSKNIQTPGMFIKFKPEIKRDELIVKKIEAYLKHTLLINLVNDLDIIYDPLGNKYIEKDKINLDNIFYLNNMVVDIKNLCWLFRISISRGSMLEYDLTLLDIKTKFIKYLDDFINNVILNKKKIILSKILNICIMSNYDNSEFPIIHIRFDILNPEYFLLIELSNYILNKITIKGIPTIEKISIKKQKNIEYDSDNAIQKNTFEYVLEILGPIDLNKIKTLKHIEYNSIEPNDIHYVYLNYGIEAAKNLIFLEISKVYKSAGTDINDEHLHFLADVMTNNGTITSIDRHGVNRLDTDPLSRASFENTVEHLLNAAAFNEIDYMRSVSSRIMAGRCFKGGTCLCDILVDNEMLENTQYNSQINVNNIITKNIEENSTMKDIINKKSIIPSIWIP